MRNRISFLDFKNYFNSFPIISTSDVIKAFPTIDKGRRLYEWVERGLIKRVIKGYYIFPQQIITENLLYLIANRIYEPSYISLQSALSWYGLIPEFVPQITSVSTKKTTNLNTAIGSFSYFSIKESLMFGYNLILFKIAYPEKAILDLLYINPHIETNEQFFELRLNSEVFKEKIKLSNLQQYLKLFSNKALTKKVNNLTEYMKNA